MDMYEEIKPLLYKLLPQLDFAITSTILYRNIQILGELPIEEGHKYLERLKTNKGIEPDMLNALIQYHKEKSEERTKFNMYREKVHHQIDSGI